MPENDFPKWIPKEELCLWCRQSTEISTAYLTDDEQEVHIWYECKNPSCEHVKRFHIPAKFGTKMTGGFSTAWKIAIAKQDEVTTSDMIPPMTEVKVESNE